MRWLAIGVLIVGCAAACSPKSDTDGPSSVVIVAPTSGQVLHGDVVEVHYRLTRGRADAGDHVHVWLDGENYGFSLDSPKILRGVHPGTHTVQVRVATEGHRFPGLDAMVTFRVE